MWGLSKHLSINDAFQIPTFQRLRCIFSLSMHRICTSSSFHLQPIPYLRIHLGELTPALQGINKSLHQAPYILELTHTLRGWWIVHIQPLHFSWQPPFALGSTRWETVCSDPGQIWWHPFYPDSQCNLQCSYNMGDLFLWTEQVLAKPSASTYTYELIGWMLCFLPWSGDRNPPTSECLKIDGIPPPPQKSLNGGT